MDLTSGSTPIETKTKTFVGLVLKSEKRYINMTSMLFIKR